MSNAESRLAVATTIEDRAERTLRVAAALSEALSAAGARPVLVGGGAVEIYTRSAYTTRDLDFVAIVNDKLNTKMTELGFVRVGRHWAHEALELVVEFPGTTLEPAQAVSIDVDGFELQIIAVEDLIVDRLAGWKHWGWDPDGAAAVILMAIHTDLAPQRLEKRAIEEDVIDALALLRPLAGSTEHISDNQLQRLRTKLQQKN